jgi:hypothetical protein
MKSIEKTTENRNKILGDLLCAALIDGLCIGDSKGLKKKIEAWADAAELSRGRAKEFLTELFQERKGAAEFEYLLKILGKLEFDEVKAS